MEMKKEVKQRISNLIDKEGLSMSEFAKRCGFNKSNFSKMIGGNNNGISQHSLRRIAQAFDVNIEWLRDGVGKIYKYEKEEGDANYDEIVGLINDEGDSLINDETNGIVLRNMVKYLQKTIAEKDEEIAFLRKTLEAKIKK